MYKKCNFQHDGKKYEIRIQSDGNKIHVRAYLNDKTANGYTYSVEVVDQVDAKNSGVLVEPVECLIKTAISDVKNGIWDEYLAAVSATGNQSA